MMRPPMLGPIQPMRPVKRQSEDSDSSLDDAELRTLSSASTRPNPASISQPRTRARFGSMQQQQGYNPGEISPEGAANAPLTGSMTALSRIESMVSPINWVLDSSGRQIAAVRKRSETCALSPRTPSKRMVYLPGPVGESCLTVSDGNPNDDALVVGVFQALERGVVKTIVNGSSNSTSPQ